MHSLMLIDGHSILNRAFYGLGNASFSTKDGVPTGALLGFFNICHRYISELQPDHLCVAFDRSEPTFRHQRYADYKGTRKPMPDDLRRQVPILKDLIDALGVCRVELAGYEADDILGTLSKRFGSPELKVWILSGDKDNFQLASDHVTIVMPEGRQAGGSATLYDPAMVNERYGVTPKEFIEVKAIMGDPSDNIPGVKGIGEKGAMKLIQNYGSLDEVYAHLDELKPGERKKLEESKENAYLSLELSAIMTDVPLELSVEQTALPDLAESGAYKLFKRYELNSLINKYGLKPQGDDDDDQTDEGGMASLKEEAKALTLKTVKVDELVELIKAAAKVAKGNSDPAGGASAEAAKGVADAGSATDTAADVGSASDVADPDAAAAEAAAAALAPDPAQAILLLADLPASYIQNDGTAPADQAALPLVPPDLDTFPLTLGLPTGTIATADISTAADLATVFDALCESPMALAGFDLKPWFRVTRSFPQTTPFDLFSAAYLLNQTTGQATTLDALCTQVLGLTPDSNDLASRVAALRALLTDQIRTIAERGVCRIAYRSDMPLVPVLASIEAAGFRVDNTVLAQLSDTFATEIDTLEATIYQECGQKFNINSPKQLGKVLYEDLGLPTGKKSATKQYSTNIEEMERLLPWHPVIAHIIRYRQLTKLRSTFVDGLAAYIAPDRRIHCSFNQNLTTTGRLSSSDPNLQNIPVRQAEGREIRKAFVASPGHILIDADYSQIELRLLAHLSGDEHMREAFREDQDIHRKTAARIFGVSMDEVTPDMRRAAKTVNFSIVYGVSDFGLSKDLGITVKEAHKYIEGYYAQYPKVQTYMDDLVARAKEDGFVETMWGRRRYIPELRSSNRNTRNFGERAAMNAPVQGSAADLMRMAMVNVDRGLREAGLKSRIISQVHDELIIEAPLDELDQASEILRRGMEEVAELSVPLQVDLETGESWFGAKS